MTASRRKNALLAGLVAMLTIALTSCQTVPEDAFQRKLDSLVGMRFAATGFAQPTDSVVVAQAESKRTHEYKWKNGCSFRIDVDKVSGLVLGWRFVSDERPCKDAMHRPLGS